MITGAVACFACLDAIIKTLAQHHPVPLLVWARWGFQTLVMVIWLAPTLGVRMAHTKQLKLQIVRSTLMIGSSVFFMSALSYLPLADATALNYTTPTLVVVLAVLFLRERMTPARLAFVVAGIVGMLFIVKPGANCSTARRCWRSARPAATRRSRSSPACSPGTIRGSRCSIPR